MKNNLSIIWLLVAPIFIGGVIIAVGSCRFVQDIVRSVYC